MFYYLSKPPDRKRMELNRRDVESGVHHDVESMSFTIDYAAQLALDEEPIPNTELARLLYHRLQTEEEE
jgi:hypothetical protein